jgi:MFS family permease
VSAHVTDALAKRNAVTFGAAQALGGAALSIIVATGGLIGQYLINNDALVTLPVSTTQLGLAAFTLPAAYFARRAGRRAASIIGAFVGVLSGALAAFAILRGDFWLFCVATFLAGFYTATVQQYRFAAADSATPAFKSRAISWVMAGGVFAAVIGPQTAIWTSELLAPVPFAGAFIGQMALAALAAALLFRLVDVEPVAASPAQSGPARPIGEILAQPRLIAAIVCGLVSYGLMSFAMTAAPMAIVACGYDPRIAWLGIQWHVLGMFAPSFVTGRLIDRFGKETVTGAGLVILAASAAVAMSGIAVAHFWISLTLLGIGWNFAFIGATALVTDCYRPSERALVQSINDFSVFGTTAVASFASGQILNAGGWNIVNAIMFPALAVAAAALLMERRLRLREA